MITIISSAISLSILIFVMVFIFRHLNDINKMNLFVYGIIFVFWVVVQVTRQTIAISRQDNLDIWYWVLVLASWQFSKLVLRYPIVKSAQIFKTKKYPLIIAGFVAMLGISSIIVFGFHTWTIMVASITLGPLSLLGFQNQYFSENWRPNRTYLTMAIVLSAQRSTEFLANIITETLRIVSNAKVGYWPDHTTFEKNARWAMISLLVLVMIAMFIRIIKKENTSNIIVNNMAGEDEHLSKMKPFHAWPAMLSSLFTTFAYAMVWKFDLMNFQIASEGEVYVESNWTLINKDIRHFGSVAFIFTTIVFAAYFVRVYNAEFTMLVGHGLTILTFIIGLFFAIYGVSSPFAWIGFMLMLNISFAIYQGAMFGVMSHFDRKNPFIILASFLFFRTLGRGLGELATGGIMGSSIDWDSSLGVALGTNGFGSNTNATTIAMSVAIATSVIGFIFTILIKFTEMKSILTIVDKYNSFDYISQQGPIWKWGHPEHKEKYIK